MFIKTKQKTIKNNKKFFYLLYISFWLIFFILIIDFFKVSYISIKLYNENKKLNEKLNELYIEKEDLFFNKTKMNKAYYVEKQARKNFGLIKKNEKLIVLKN